MVLVFFLHLVEIFCTGNFFRRIHLSFRPFEYFIRLYAMYSFFNKLPVLHHFIYIISDPGKFFVHKSVPACN